MSIRTNGNGLSEFKKLTDTGQWEIVSTPETEELLVRHNIPVIRVETVTGMQNLMGGRINLLHQSFAAGILFRPDNPKDQEDIVFLDTAPIHMVVANVGSFEQTPGVDRIVIGEAMLLLAAAANCMAVVPLIHSKDYLSVVGEIISTGNVSPDLRVDLATEVFVTMSKYYHQVANWYIAQSGAQNFEALIPG